MKKLFVFVLFLSLPLFTATQSNSLFDYSGVYKFDGALFEKNIIGLR